MDASDSPARRLDPLDEELDQLRELGAARGAAGRWTAAGEEMSLDSAAIAEVGPGYFVLSPGEVRETRPGVILTHGPIPMPEFVEPGRV
jgi:hypothetical protein